jgi:hypothetical protein
MTPNEEAAGAVTRAAQREKHCVPDYPQFDTNRQPCKTAFMWPCGYVTPTPAPEARNSHEPARANGMFRGKPHPVLHGDRNQCPTCGELFNSTTAFDKHRIGSPDNRVCLTLGEMRAQGFTSPGGFWHSPASRADRERLARLKRRQS